VLSWEQFAEWLSKPVWGAEKTEAGGYSPAKYKDNIRHLDKMDHVCVLVFDIDVNGDTSRVAERVQDYSCIIHETFSSTTAMPRCRLLMQLKDPIDANTYTRAHKKVRKELHERHVWADENATDASRLSYSPVRPAGSGYQFARTPGPAVDARTKTVGWLEVPKVVRNEVAGKANVTKLYIESAILSAQMNVRMANDGARHATLLKEANSLSRVELGLSFEQVEEALFDTALERMGAGRAHEIRAAIRDAFARMRTRGQ